METNAKIKPLNKQETLEEAAERYGKQVLDERKSKNLSIDEEIWLSGGSILGFIDGAKWQQDMADKKYTEEDLRNAIREGRNSVHFENDGSWWEDKTVEEDFIKSLNKQD
jgi:hypothetical protein